jgi:hypothetical protein
VSLGERGEKRLNTTGLEGNIRMDVKRNMVGRCGLNSSDSGQGPVAVCCEHSNEPSGSIKVWVEFID